MTNENKYKETTLDIILALIGFPIMIFITLAIISGMFGFLYWYIFLMITMILCILMVSITIFQSLTNN